MSAEASAAPAKAARRAQLKVLLATMLRAWGRAVVTIVGSSLLLGALGLSEVSGYATIPGIYMALSPPVGGRSRRVETVVVATLVIAAMSVIAAELTRWTVAVALSLAAAGFVAGLLPRLGSLAAAMQLPLLMSFAYSVGQPLSDAGALSRGLAVLVALPIYVVAVALAFQVDQRRPLVLGAAQALGSLATALGHAASGAATRAENQAALAQFRAAITRLRDSALPLGGSRGDHAGLALVGAVQEAVVAADLLDDTRATAGSDRRGWLVAAAHSAGATAARLAGRPTAPAPVAGEAEAEAGRPAGPAPLAIETIGEQARAAGDHPVWLLADALADAQAATAVLTGEAGASLPATAVGALPSPWRRLVATLDVDDPAFRRAVRLGLAAGLAGLAAALLDLGRAYWPVFSVIVIFNAPAAQDWRRALERLGGTVLGFFVALPLIELAGTSQALAMGIALALLLPGLVLMPINYGAAMVFITSTVGLMYAAGGTVDDFVSFRVEDTLVGAAIAAGIGLLLWHTKHRDWWTAAGRMARALADAALADAPARHRDGLVMKALALRTETVEGAALPTAGPGFGAAWLYTAASESLVRTLSGPSAAALDDPEALAAGLREIAAACDDEGALAALPASPSDAGEELTEMATAISALR